MESQYSHSGDDVPKEPSSVTATLETMNRVFRKSSGGKIEISPSQPAYFMFERTDIPSRWSNSKTYEALSSPLGRIRSTSASSELLSCLLSRNMISERIIYNDPMEIRASVHAPSRSIQAQHSAHATGGSYPSLLHDPSTQSSAVTCQLST